MSNVRGRWPNVLRASLFEAHSMNENDREHELKFKESGEDRERAAAAQGKKAGRRDSTEHWTMSWIESSQC